MENKAKRNFHKFSQNVIFESFETPEFDLEFQIPLEYFYEQVRIHFVLKSKLKKPCN